MLRKIGPFFLPLAVACICVKPARAQYFTNHEGYTDAGQYRLQVELSPYLWLPAMSESFAFAHSAMDAHAAGSFGSPVPSLGTLAFSRQFSFMGDGVLRYGPYSTELDIQYVSASGSKPFSFANQLHVNTSYVRIAPGLGYQVYAGKALTIPVSVDARAGFSYFENWENLQGEGNLSGEAGRNDNFVQPWVGTRIDFVPGPRWRVELASIIQGMGIDSGSWGWGASGIISYALNDWVALNAGYSALNTERNGGNYDTPGAPKRSLELTAYGPVFGMTFRFGHSPPRSTTAHAGAGGGSGACLQPDLSRVF